MRCSRCVIACAFPRAARRASLTGPASRGDRAAVARPRRQTSRPQRAHALRHARVDPGAGAIAALRHGCLAGQPLPAARGTHPVCGRRGARLQPTTSGAARAGPAGLWSQGISGDLPIVLLRVEDVDDLRAGAAAPAGARILGHQAPLGGPGHPQRARRLLHPGPAGGPRSGGAHQPGAPAHRRHRHPRQGVRAAHRPHHRGDPRAVVSRRTRGAVGPARQPCRPGRTHAARSHRGAAVAAANSGRGRAHSPIRKSARKLEFFNGLGGFDAQGREYRDHRPRWPEHSRAMDQRDREPGFGFQVGSDGGGYTWSRNSRENALTPWSNDPVANRPGETIYLRDEETGELWTRGARAHPPRRARSIRARTAWATAASNTSRTASRSSSRCSCRSRIPSRSAGCACATIRRAGAASRSPPMSSGCWARRAPAARRTSSPSWMRSGALFARNPWNQPFPGVAFADLRGAQTEFTCDRREFLGRHGMLDAPAALVSGAPFSGRAGAGLDPCAALRTRLELEPSASTEIVFLLGEAADGDAARALLTRYRERRHRRGARRRCARTGKSSPVTCRSRRRTVRSTS